MGEAASSVEVTQVVLMHAYEGVYAAYAWKDVIITVWFNPATVESVAAFAAGCKKLEGTSARVSTVHLMVPGGRTLPSTEARHALIRVFKDYAPYTVSVAVVIPGTGFWAGAIRSLVTALTIVVPGVNPPRIFADIDGVAAWLPEVHREKTGNVLEPAELFRALREAAHGAF